jgi:MaoC like domain
MRALYARVALSPLRRGRGSGLPEREVAREAVTVDRDRLAAYDRVCGFRLRDELPATYPHVLAFPLALELLTDREFPFSPLGLVHIANRIELLRPIGAHERLDLRVRAADMGPHDRGTQFTVLAEAAVAGEPVWRGRSLYLHREGGGSGRSGDGEDAPVAAAVWRVPADIGRRYARVSGDANPIHLHPLTARLFGQPAPIAHGMWTAARCLAAYEGSLPPAFAFDVRFKAPLRLPARVTFWRRGFEFGVVGAARPHVEGVVTPANVNGGR